MSTVAAANTAQLCLNCCSSWRFLILLMPLRTRWIDNEQCRLLSAVHWGSNFLGAC